MTRTFGKSLLGAGIVAAGAVGVALAGAGSAAAAPTYIGPVYYEITDQGIFGPVECEKAVAAERAAGNIILVACQPVSSGAWEGAPSYLRVGIDANLGSS